MISRVHVCFFFRDNTWRKGAPDEGPTHQGECGRFRRVGAAIRSEDAGETRLPQSRIGSRQRRLAIKLTSTWQHHEMQWVSGRDQVTPTARHSSDGTLVQPIRKLARTVMKLRCSLSANGFAGEESGQNEGRTLEKERSRRRCVLALS